MKIWLLWVAALGALFSVPGYCGKLPPLGVLKGRISGSVTTGKVCEEIARIKLEHLYPKNKYLVETGVEYKNSVGETLGEIDAVVLEKSSKRALLAAEVKCSRDLSRARRKGRKQIAKYRELMHWQSDLEFYLKAARRVHYRQNQFDEGIPFILISQQGGEIAGFDLTLDYSLEELYELTKKLAGSR